MQGAGAIDQLAEGRALDSCSVQVDPDEFFEAIGALGYDVPRTVADALFDRFDTDGSGTIDYRELHAVLKKEEERRGDAARGVQARPHVFRLSSEGEASHRSSLTGVRQRT